MIKSYGMFPGRHELPVTEFVYQVDYTGSPLEFDYMIKEASAWLDSVQGEDTVFLYVTGLTIGLVAILQALQVAREDETVNNNIVPDVFLFHFDRVSGEYINKGIF